MARGKAKAPSIGDNSAKEEQNRKALFHINRRAYKEALAVKKAADAKLKNVAKTVKSDLGEFGLQQIKDYDLAQTPEGQAALKAEIDARAQAMRFAGMAVNSQVDMFTDLAPLAERAFAMGEEAGMRGDSLQNPYNEGSVEGQQFAAGWHAGQEAIFAITKKREEAAADEIIKGSADGDDPFPDADNDDGEQRVAAE
jgi:hypothetical protein